MLLSGLASHNRDSVELEQYSIDGDLAARWLADITAFGDLSDGCSVAPGSERLPGKLIGGRPYPTKELELDPDPSFSSSDGTIPIPPATSPSCGAACFLALFVRGERLVRGGSANGTLD